MATNYEIKRMAKFKTPYKLVGNTYVVNKKGEIKEGVYIIDKVSGIIAQITFVYVDGTFLAPTAYEVSSPTGYGEHRFHPSDEKHKNGFDFIKV